MILEINIYTERVDDIPILFGFLKQMGIQETIDKIVNTHGNHQGLSIGWLTTAWLIYIVSQSDHRMVEVESWADKHIQTLTALIQQPLNAKDFTDDRLADVLGWFSKDNVWEEIENHLCQHLISVYDLQNEPEGLPTVRLDSTTASVYHDTENSTLFAYGYSKDHRPDLPQFKVMLSSLDPMGLPIATLVLSGSEADDGLYIPAVIRSRHALGCGGRLYVGDSKMSAIDTRAFIQSGGDYYLTPLSCVGDVPQKIEELLEPVWNKQQTLTLIRNDDEAIAVGYETVVHQTHQGMDWDERVLVVYSPSMARNARRGLSQRLDKAEQAIRSLTPDRGRGKRQYKDLNKLESEVKSILKKHAVEGLLKVSYNSEEGRRTIRGYGGNPSRIDNSIRYIVDVERDDRAIRKTRILMGWRLYVTNTKVIKLPLSKAVNIFRKSPVIERNFSRLKGHPLGIHPLYVRREDHACGLIRLLSIALRLLTLLEHVLRSNLQSSDESMSGLYAGNPKRETSRPTTERLLKAFDYIDMSVVQLDNQTIYHITPLSELQKHILFLLSLSPSLYEGLELSPNTS
ncbi:MAG: IS1634 family transposase [Deltaproteobacteria bacterium]|nr:IS1634 family transposase [Deltaproteobacteria bacterium]